jgi:hypothetical protein
MFGDNMNNERKERLAVKLASTVSWKGEGIRGLVGAGKDTIGTFGKDLVGKEGLDLGGRIGRALTPKKSLVGRMFGSGSVGRKALMFGAGAAGIAGGIKGLDIITDSISDPLKKRSYKNKMFTVTPALKKANQTDVGRIFNTLYKFNPKMASDPLVASSFVRRSLQFKEEGIQPVDVKTLAEVKEKMERGQGKGLLSEAFSTGVGTLAGLA